MANAAHELADILSSWRSLAPNNGVGILAKSASDLGYEESDLLEHTADLARRTNLMFTELLAAGVPMEHFSSAKRAWSLAPYLYGAGWTGGGGMDPDAVIREHELSLLRAFAGTYDYASRLPTPNAAALSAFILELDPIADFVMGLDISDASKTLVLGKIANTKSLLESGDFQFEVVLTRLGEILGLLILLAESGISDEDKDTLWKKARGFAAKFGSDMTVNLVSSALSSGFMQAITS